MCNEQSIYDAIATVNFYSKGQHLDSVNIQGLCEPPIQMSTRTRFGSNQNWTGEFEPPFQIKAGKALSQWVFLFGGHLSVAS